MTTTVLLSQRIIDEFASKLSAIRAGSPGPLRILPFTRDLSLPPEAAEGIDAAYYSRDVWEGTVKSALSPSAAAFWQILDRAAGLKWLHVYSAGTDNERYLLLMQRGVRLTTSAGAQAESVGYAAVTGLLALARRFPHYWAAQQRGVWSPLKAAEVPDLRGQRALILGTGHIGSVIARCLQAFGLRTIGMRRQVGPTPHFDDILPLAALDDQLPACDWLIIACPLVPETRALIDARRLALLPRTAGLVNIARGEIVDEQALAAALASGALGSAFLDVFSVEPLPPESPFWRLPNVIISPHNAGASAGTYGRGVETFLRNLERFLHRQPLVNEAQRD